MPTPKVLNAINELDKTGFYNNPVYLGDIREVPTCLDNVTVSGIYTFDGGFSHPSDTGNTNKWSLRVYTSDDCTKIIQEVERIMVSSIGNPLYKRAGKYIGNTIAWGEFVKLHPITCADIGAEHAIEEYVNDTSLVDITVADHTFYKLSDVTSLTMKGANVSCGGFIKFSSSKNPTVKVDGFSKSEGDKITSALKGELWEFSVAPSPIEGDTGYIIWKYWR